MLFFRAISERGKWDLSCFRHIARAIATLSVIAALSPGPAFADDSYFESRLRLPPLQGFEKFYQTAPGSKGANSYQRWELTEPAKGVTPRAYLLANPKSQLWVTLVKGQAPQGQPDNSPVRLKDFDKLFSPALKTHGFTVTGIQYEKYPAGSASIYTIGAGLPNGYQCLLIGLTPKSDNNPKDAFFFQIVFTSSSKSQALNLAGKLLNKAWIAPS